MARYADALGLPLVHAGKVRELYALDGDRLLMVATDRISAFDHVLEPLVPDKGVILNQMCCGGSAGWRTWWTTRDLHRGAGGGRGPGGGVRAADDAAGRVRGPWLSHRIRVAGVPRVGVGLRCRTPGGLMDGSRLPEPIFTPTTKAALGEHDVNIDFATVMAMIGRKAAVRVRALTLGAYAQAEKIARDRGIILADTKFEFGRRADGTIVLADEVLTPDSSRFWDAERWQPGGRLESFDKQFVRNWLLNESGWDRSSGAPPPRLPDNIVTATRAKYVEAYERLTGTPFVPR
jgi:phosphoribosylaminoimidazole-succinocarboxamide synthase